MFRENGKKILIIRKGNEWLWAIYSNIKSIELSHLVVWKRCRKNGVFHLKRLKSEMEMKIKERTQKDTFTNWYEYRMRGINTHWQLDGDSKTQSGCQSPLKIRLPSEQKTERGWGREKHTERLGQREVLITFETSGRSSNTENCVQDIQSKHT